MNQADGLFTDPAMADIWSDQAFVDQMLAFEAALAHAEAQAGIIPVEAAAAIASACRVELFDVGAVFTEAVVAGTPVIPLVRMLTERVTEDARGYVHWGATSQDAIDTATVLRMREGLSHLIDRLFQVGELCASLSKRYYRSPMAGRTLLQQALPITFGLKAARWLALTTRQIERLGELRSHIAVVQFGGATGTLASLGQAGTAVTEHLAAALGLAVPDLPWHAERDRIAGAAAALGVTAGSMAKIATDIVLMAQTEVGEVSEASEPSKGQSSTLPQKRNPVDAVMALAAARLAIGVVPVVLGAAMQEHERAAGSWQAEWQAVPDIFRFTAGTVSRVQNAMASLDVHGERMRANCDLSKGLIMAESLTMALAHFVGRHEAYRIVRAASERAVASGMELRQVAHGDEDITNVLSVDAIDQALDPAGYLGSTAIYIDRALQTFDDLTAREVGQR